LRGRKEQKDKKGKQRTEEEDKKKGKSTGRKKNDK
jgi:hypothetical protein